MTKLFGEQDSRNKISYTKWARQIKVFIGSKGADGMELARAMNWAENTTTPKPYNGLYGSSPLSRHNNIQHT